jgi:hypothetical protein
MKKINLRLMTLMISGLFILSGSHLTAQESIKKETREVAAFTGIDVGGAFEVLLGQGDAIEVVVETEEKFLEKVKTNVKGGVLELSSTGIKNADHLKVYVTVPELNDIDVHGAASIKYKSAIKGDKLTIKASGASDARLDIYYNSLETKVSGAATLKLSGEVTEHHCEVSGAGTLRAGELSSKIANATASGAGSAVINATDKVVSSTSGAGTVDLTTKPEKLSIVSGEIVGETENINVYTNDYGDTTKVRVAGIRVEVIENDSTKVIIGNRKITVDESGNVKWCKVKKRKFNGHWAGVELAVNGFLTKDFDMKFKPEDEYMDLRMEKSMQVNLNFYEQNVALSKKQNWGMLTGFGLSWNNYRFNRPTTLNPDSAYLIGYIDKGISVRKSKLAIAYLQVPLIIEWQNHSVRKINSFHVAAGIIFGVRLWSWQKKYYNELNKEYTLTQYDPATGNYEDKWLRTSPNYNKTHTYDDFHLQPFKADATFRIGWGYVNLFATYNLLPMFRKDKGPDLHQFAAGITLLGW